MENPMLILISELLIFIKGPLKFALLQVDNKLLINTNLATITTISQA